MDQNLKNQLQEKIWLLHTIAEETREFIENNKHILDPAIYAFLQGEVARTEVKFRELKNAFDKNINIVEIAKNKYKET